MKSTIACLLIAFICGTCATSIVYKFEQDGMTMLEQMDLALEIPYEMKDGTMGSAKIAVGNATVDKESSSLNSTYAVLQLGFGELNVHNLIQTFKSDGKDFYMEEMTFTIFHDEDIFVNAKDNKTATFTMGEELFRTTLGRSYACDGNVIKQIGKSEPKFNMSFSSMKLQPFGVSDDKFSRGEHCAADPTTAGPSTSPASTTSSNTPTGTPPVTTPSNTTTGTAPLTTSINTTTEALTTAMTPPPKPVYINKLNVTDKKGNNCIMEQIKATFTLHKNKNKIVVNMTDAEVDQAQSRCGNKTKNESAVLFAVFGDLDAYTLRQEFAVNNDDKYYYLKRLTLHLIVDDGKKGPENVTFDVVMKNNDTFHVPFGRSLKCDAEQDIKANTSEYNVTMAFSKLKLQAFDIKNSQYNSTYECPTDHAISNIVPIAVGCALAVLVIIVLVAYLIGRRNSSRAGYESV